MHPKSRPWIWFYPLVMPLVKLHLRRIHGPTSPPPGHSPPYTHSSTVSHQYLGVGGGECQLRKVYTCAHLTKLVAGYIEWWQCLVGNEHLSGRGGGEILLKNDSLVPRRSVAFHNVTLIPPLIPFPNHCQYRCLEVRLHITFLCL